MLNETLDFAVPIPNTAPTGGVGVESPASVDAAGVSSGTKEPDRRETILLVEDDPQVRELTRVILRRGGFNVLAADSECQALWLWTRHSRQIDLLVTDMLIPHCSTGVELAKKLQNSKAALPVVYISGFGKEIGDEDPDFFRRSPFLQKPVDPAALIEAVLNCLEAARKTRHALN